MENDKKQPSKIIKWSLIATIVILLNLFFAVSINLFLDEPKYENFCKNSYPEKQINSEENCRALDGTWQNYSVPEKNPDGTLINGYCDMYAKCNSELNSATESHELKVFIALIIFGLLTFIISLLFTKTNSLISTALSLAAVLDFIIASMRYWSSANELFRFIILLLALVILIYIAIKKFGDKIN